VISGPGAGAGSCRASFPGQSRTVASSIRKKNGGAELKAFLEPIDRKDEKIRLTKPVNVVGRLPVNDVRIDHVSLSRRHAVLVMTEGLVVVRDLATTNGTRVNGKKVRWAALMPNDTIAFGTQKFRVVYGPDTKYEPDLRQALAEPESMDKGSSISYLFATSDPAIRPGRHVSAKKSDVADESLSDLELFDESQNTELGGWRPGKGE